MLLPKCASERIAKPTVLILDLSFFSYSLSVLNNLVRMHSLNAETLVTICPLETTIVSIFPEPNCSAT